MAKQPSQGRVRRRERKNITSGVAHVNSTFNNTMITITDVQGKPSPGHPLVAWVSRGRVNPPRLPHRWRQKMPARKLPSMA